jgi:hypothetical protein
MYQVSQESNRDKIQEGKDGYTRLSSKTLKILRAYFKTELPNVYLFEGREVLRPDPSNTQQQASAQF